MAVAERNINSATAKATCSVCVANYNGRGVIADCIESVLTQRFDRPVEVIVHDDASRDGSPEFIRARYPSVHLLVSETNVGFSASNNRMAARARGQYLLFLNNDARLRPDALATLFQYATLKRFDGILGLPQYDWTTGRLVDIGSLFDPFLNPVPNYDQQRRQVAMVMGSCLWISKSLWDKLGGFPEWFGSLAEDMYLCGAAWNAGYSVVSLPESGYQHWIGKSFGGGRIADDRLQTTFARRALSERNKSFVMVIYMPWALLAIILPMHLLALGVEAFLLTVLKRSSAPWRKIYWPCYHALWRNRKMLWERRRLAQKNRRLSLLSYLRFIRPVPYKLRMLFRHGLPELS